MGPAPPVRPGDVGIPGQAITATVVAWLLVVRMLAGVGAGSPPASCTAPVRAVNAYGEGARRRRLGSGRSRADAVIQRAGPGTSGESPGPFAGGW